MKHLSLFVALGVLAFAFGLSGDVQPAHAFGDWWRGDGGCTVKHEPRVRHRVVRKHVVKRPGIYEIHRRSGVYGYRKVKVRTRSGRIVYRKKRVLLKPYENIVRYHEPKERWVYKRQRIYAPAPSRPRGAWPDSC
ncbi:hypothetical protein [Dichotomicrobium thermohalophilum]|uniref:Uncharacterized protein n=1 Tax=Dichotomicrobium thermohalophilum TaxID=933063 RepID=A0A397Q2J4_9HYPH|nr:hypothetical protein [Dichotomicrobium thermohalophilum]RIA55278.1 hypothetical protein BXY53_0339 [Dichotomicrobium thermohalophilum]